MSNKISSETKTSVLNLFKDGESQAEIAEKCGISRRSVGRIIDNGKKSNEDEYAKPLELDVYSAPSATLARSNSHACTEKPH